MQLYHNDSSKKPLPKQAKPLNENVQRYIRCTKRLGQAYSVTVLAEAASVSRRYIQRKADAIKAYHQTAPIATDEDIKWFDARSIDYYLKNATDARMALGAIAGYLMKYRYDLLGHLRKVSHIRQTGSDVTSLITTIKSRKHTTGTPIQAISRAVKNLQNQNKIIIDALFIRTGGYYAGHTSKLWKTTGLADQILADAITILFDKITNENVHFVIGMGGNCCRTWTVTYSSKCCRVSAPQINTTIHNIDKRVFCWHIKPLGISFKQVQQLCLSSMLHIISQSIGFENGNFIVSLNHTSKTNPSLGRNYNVFTRLRSFERKQLGYLNYDMSCALQTISLQLIQAPESVYPLLTRYSKDIAFKRQLRTGIANDLNIAVTDVKQKLTAFSNGAVSGVDKHPIYKQFQFESDKLRIEVLAHMATHNPQLLQQAQAQSKKHLSEDIDWFTMSTEDSQALARGKSSVYFFIWTYYERLIRKAMLDVLIDGIEVHDAVYSKMNVSTEYIEAVIFESTGFKIIIDKE